MKLLSFSMILISSLLCFSGCESELPGAYSDYSFSRAQLRKGIVNKYYETNIFHSDDNHGNVLYRSYQLLDDGTLLTTYYNAAKEVQKIENHSISEEGKKLIGRKSYSLRDTILYEIISAESSRWEEGRTSLTNISYTINANQVSDSTQYTIGAEIAYLDIPVREVSQTTKREIYQDGAYWHSYEWDHRMLYAKNLDMVLYERHYEEYDTKIELIEQMSLSDFEKLEIPYTKRIAYIDPDDSWSPEGFEVCYNYVYDYYSLLTPELKGGKKELQDFVSDRYDPEKYKDQSGYLSIHFMINCRGETGRFKDYSHSLDFEEDTFSDPIKDQMMSIIKEKKDWIPQINEHTNKAVDAYHYVTFRIKNGIIDEILP